MAWLLGQEAGKGPLEDGDALPGSLSVSRTWKKIGVGVAVFPWEVWGFLLGKRGVKPSAGSWYSGICVFTCQKRGEPAPPPESLAGDAQVLASSRLSFRVTPCSPSECVTQAQVWGLSVRWSPWKSTACSLAASSALCGRAAACPLPAVPQERAERQERSRSALLKITFQRAERPQMPAPVALMGLERKLERREKNHTFRARVAVKAVPEQQGEER